MHYLALRLLLAVSLVLACATAAGAEPRDERPRVLLIVDDPASPLIRRLSAELAELDVNLVTGPPAARLDAAARAEGAVAAIRVVPAKNGVEVWMEATSGRSLLRQVIVDEGPAGPNYNNVALQTAELLRTSLLYGDKPEPEPAPAPAPAPPAPVKRDTAPEPPPRADSEASRGRGGLEAGLGALYSPGGVSTAFQAWAAGHYPLEPWLALGAELSFPIHRGKLAGPEGSAELGCYAGAATLTLRWQRAGVPWFAGAGLGAGVLHVASTAEAVPPLSAEDASSLTGLAYLRVEAGVGLSPWLRFGARSLAGLALPRVEVEFAGNQAGTWGSPLLGVMGFLEVPLG